MFRGLCLTFGKEIWRVTKRHKTHFYREVGIETDGRDTEQDLKEIKAIFDDYKVWPETKIEERGRNARAVGYVKQMIDKCSLDQWLRE